MQDCLLNVQVTDIEISTFRICNCQRQFRFLFCSFPKLRQTLLFLWNAGCPYSSGTQVVHLIFHKRNQWRNYKAYSIEINSRHLKTDRFAASGWHKRQGVVTTNYRLNNFLLQGSETTMPPVFY